MIEVTDDNFTMVAARAYQKLNPTMAEMEEDLMRIQYIKRLVAKYLETGELKERLILNHIIILSNVFGVEMATTLLVHKCDKPELKVVKPFLVMLDYLPDRMRYRGKWLNTDEVPLDRGVVKALRGLNAQGQ